MLFDDHNEVCPGRIIPCPQDCGQRLKRSQMDARARIFFFTSAHADGRAPRALHRAARSSTLPHAEILLTLRQEKKKKNDPRSGDIQEHCAHTLLDCPNVGDGCQVGEIKRCNLEHHVGHDCLAQTIVCPIGSCHLFFSRSTPTGEWPRAAGAITM